MILRGLSNVCEVDFVVRAPDGKEVEELTRKDIIKALRTRIPIEQALSRLNHGGGHGANGNRPHSDARRGSSREGTTTRGRRCSSRSLSSSSSRCSSRLPQEPQENILSPTEISANMRNPTPEGQSRP